MFTRKRPVVMVDFLGARENPADPALIRKYPRVAALYDQLRHHCRIWMPDGSGDKLSFQVNRAIASEIQGYLLVVSGDEDITEENYARLEGCRSVCPTLVIWLDPPASHRYPILRAWQGIDFSNWHGDNRSSPFPELQSRISSLRPRQNRTPEKKQSKSIELPPESPSAPEHMRRFSNFGGTPAKRRR